MGPSSETKGDLSSSSQPPKTAAEASSTTFPEQDGNAPSQTRVISYNDYDFETERPTFSYKFNFRRIYQKALSYLLDRDGIQLPFLKNQQRNYYRYELDHIDFLCVAHANEAENI